MGVYRCAGSSNPDTWAKMAYMHHGAGSPRREEYRASFGDIPVYTRGPHQKGYRIVVLRSMIQCLEQGLYVLAVRCSSGGFLLVDGEPVLTQSNRYERREWNETRPRLMKAGLHTIEVYVCSGSRLRLQVGWRKPDDTAIEPFGPGSLLCATRVSSVRLERSDRALQPHFTFRPQPTYTFAGSDAVFSPFTFKNDSASPADAGIECSWSLGDGTRADGETVEHVYREARRFSASLQLRDRVGSVQDVTRWVDCRFPVPTEHLFSAHVDSLPAACYPSDIVEPFLALAADAPGNLALKISWRLSSRSGKDRFLERDLTVSDLPMRLPLTRQRVDELAAVEWKAMHHGVVLAEGTVEFLTPPFAVLPASVEGGGLYGPGGERLVLVPHQRREQYSQPRIATTRALEVLACVDDMLAAPTLPVDSSGAPFDRVLSRIVGGAEGPSVRYVPVGVPEGASSYAPVFKLVRIPAAVTPDTDAAIVSVALQDIVERVDPAVFERHAAALSDLISASMNCPIVWTTPPPYPGQYERVRPFASAIQRAADARCIPVADLFTAFAGAGGGAVELFRCGGPGLSRAGRELAARVIANALLRE
jgi:hypothetical protein